jgi:hypothetical protein
VKEYKKFLKEMETKLPQSELKSDKINEAIHTAIISKSGSSKYNKALDYILESMEEREEEEMCEECDEEYDSLTEDDKMFLEDLADSDDDKKMLMFDELKEKAISEADCDMDKAVEEGDMDSIKDIKEAIVNIGKMKMNESNIIKLYEFSKKNK